MSSEWKQFAESWLEGTVALEELVVAAGLEGELSELQIFLLEHPRSFGSFLKCCFLPYDWTLRASMINQETLMLYCCRASYDLVSHEETEKGLRLIQKVCEGQQWQHWLQDALMSTVDAVVRNEISQFFRKSKILTNEEDRIVRKIVLLQSVYPVENYKESLEKCLSFSKILSSSRMSLEQIDGLLMKFSRKNLREDITGISLIVKTGNLWENLLHKVEEWKTISFSRSHQEKAASSSSPLFFKAAGNWFQHLSEEDFDRIVLEGELLASHLTGSPIQSGLLEDPVQRWRAQILFSSSHHMIHDVVSLLDNIPDSCRSKSLLRVFRNQQECLSIQVEVLDVLNNTEWTSYGQYIVEANLIKQGIWLQTQWQSVDQWISFLSRTGTLFGTHPVHEDVKNLLQQKEVVKLLVEYCASNGLAMVLELLLEKNSTLLKDRMLESFLSSAGNCDWAQCLMLSKVSGFSFLASMINAKYIFNKEKIKIESLGELAQNGSLFMALGALSQVPIPLTESLVLTKSDLPTQKSLLSPVAPYCSISELELQLQETFPETLEALKSVAVKGKSQGKLTCEEFNQWRSSMFRKELGDLAFLDMVDCCGIPEFTAFFKVHLDCNLDASGGQEKEEIGFWEEKMLVKVDQWVEETSPLTGGPAPGLSVGLVHHLSSGRPIAALVWYLATKDSPQQDHLTEEDLFFLEKITRMVAILSFRDSAIISSCLVFAAGVGFTTNKIKIETCTLQTIDQNDKSSSFDIMKLANDLAQKVLKETFPVLEQKQEVVTVDILTYLESIALEETQLKMETTVLEQGADVMLRWCLLHAFARIHGLPLSKRFLIEMAKADDWILFLAEANTHQDSIEEVIEIAEHHFSDVKLKHHVCLILKHPAEFRISRNTPSFTDLPHGVETGAFTEYPVSTELFDILMEAEKTGDPCHVLLHWAWKLNWRLLAIIAACYPSSCCIQCLNIWLRIGKNENLVCCLEEQDRILELSNLVCQHCSEGNFEDLIRAFTLFPLLPLEPIQHFLEGMQCQKQQYYKASIRHFTSFEDSLDHLITQQIITNENLYLLQQISQTAIYSFLHSLDSIYQKQKLLNTLTRLESKDNLPWLASTATLHLTYQLLGNTAEEYICWKKENEVKQRCPCPQVNLQQVMKKLQLDERWLEARHWAQETNMNIVEVTTHQAEDMVKDWIELELPFEVLWEEINDLFLQYEYPPLKAGLFYIQQASKLHPASNIQELLLEGLKWLDGRKVPCKEPVNTLTDQLRRTVSLMDCTEDIVGVFPTNKNPVFAENRIENCPAIQMILRPICEDLDSSTEESKSAEFYNSSLSVHTMEDSFLSIKTVLSSEEQEGLCLLEELIPIVSKDHGERTVKLLLDHGQIDAARDLAKQEKLTDQVEFYLLETAFNIIHTCSSNQWTEEAPEELVLTSIRKFLNKKGYLRSVEDPEEVFSPQEVLDAVVMASKDTGGYPVCARAASSFRTATLLNISCVELASFSPSTVLELILLKGSGAFHVAREFVSTFDFTSRSIASKLAHFYLTSLLKTSENHSMTQEHRVSRHKVKKEATRKLNCCNELITESNICSDWVTLGNSLMQLLIEQHGVLPALVESEILVQAFKCYERVGYVEGIDVLLDLATSRVHQFSTDDEFEALVKLIVGICRFDGLMEALDSIVKTKKLDLLLQDYNSHDPSIFSTLRCAVLSSIYRQCSGDPQMLSLTHRHFNMHVELGHGLKERAKKLLNRYIEYGRPVRDPGILEAMDLLIHAGCAYSCAQCSISASECGSLLALVAQQACYREKLWICLTDSQCKSLLPEISHLTSALLVARAYSFNSPQDWVLTLWQHMLFLANELYGVSTSSGSSSRVLDGFFQYCQGLMKEIVFTEDHLDQLVQMYLAFPSMGGLSNKDQINYDMLAKCMIQFLKSLLDSQLQMKFCSLLKKETYISSNREFQVMFNNISESLI